MPVLQADGVVVKIMLFKGVSEPKQAVGINITTGEDILAPA